MSLFSLLTLPASPLTGGPATVMVAELFLQETRPAAVAIATTASWFASFVVNLTFPYILVRGGRGRGEEERSMD